MPVDALGVLLVAVPVLLKELTDGDLVLHVPMQVLALLSLAADLLEPVHAHLLLELGQVRLLDDRRHNVLQFTNTCDGRLPLRSGPSEHLGRRAKL